MKTKKYQIKKIYLVLGIILFSLATKATTINLKLFIQGYYLGGGQMRPVRMNQGCPIPNSSTVTSLITVALKSSIAPFAIVASTVATLNTDGTCVVNFPNLSGTYYLNVTGCNFSGNCSASPITVGAIPTAYDFTTSASQAYASNQVEVSPGVWAFVSGDVNQDGNTGLLDIAVIQAAIFNSGCTCNDLDGDGNVGLSDLVLLTNNMNNFLGNSSCFLNKQSRINCQLKYYLI